MHTQISQLAGLDREACFFEQFTRGSTREPFAKLRDAFRDIPTYRSGRVTQNQSWSVADDYAASRSERRIPN
jgi:hypothetical protein